ncbi:MAG: hypothetical protein ABSA46_09515 [Thermodesulfovibrionales bacterium]|jgi:hypothetical protein
MSKGKETRWLPYERLPGQREQGLYIRLETVIFAFDDHAALRAIAATIFYHNVNGDAGLPAVRAGDVKLPRSLGKVPVLRTVPHLVLLYTLADNVHQREGSSSEPDALKGHGSAVI